MSQKLPLSLVIIALNEEANIERCIASVPFASEVLLLDSGSVDRTCEIAKSLGARVEVANWSGFGPQKRKATELASYDWVLSLDCDECLSPEAQVEILTRFENLKPECGYYFPRLSRHLGRWIRHGGWYPDYQLRLFNRRCSQWSSARIHEFVESTQEDFFTKPIQHYVFKNLTEQVLTNDRYSSLQAEDEIRRSRPFRIWRLVFKPITKFFECYFLKLGFLDGIPGLVIAVGAGYSVFLRWAKVWEMGLE